MKIRTLALTLAAVAACRGSSSDHPDASNTNPDGVNGGDVTIYDVQNPDNRVAVGATVDLKGVVVTAIDNYGNKKGNFWVQEPGGGEYSGVLVFKADPTVVGSLAIGDLVDVTGGVKSEFALSGTGGDTSGRTTTEIEPASGGAITVTKVGTGAAPAPIVVDALKIGQLGAGAAQDAEWEKYEGVLITVNNVAVIGSTKAIGGKTPDPTFNSFTITGGLLVESSLAAFPGTTGTPVGPQFGDCMGSVTGVGDYFFNWIVEPRTTAEIAVGGTSCPPPESDATACGDGIDNDGNGHADCADFSCDLAVASCVKTSSITNINNGTTAVGAAVNLSGVYVTALDTAKKNIWVADALAGATNGGILAYNLAGTAPPGNLQVGSQVSIGNVYVSSYHGLKELSKIPGGTPTFTVDMPKAGDPTALAATIANLTDATAGPTYVGALVTISNAKVTAVNGKVYTISDGTHTMELAGYLYDPKPAMGACIKTITGAMTLDTTPNPSVPMLEPRTQADITAAGGACN
jgi:hypothetical protein